MRDRRRSLIASAPSRLDFGGGWTDVPPYPEERGGFVCNVAITRRATVRLSPSDTTSVPRGLPEAALERAQLRGVDVTVENDFPVGAGLGGSSAAGVAMAAAIHALRDLSPSASDLAEWSRAVEVEEMRIAGGRQDHYAAAFGGALGLSFGASVDVERIVLSSAARSALEQRCLLVYSGESRISGVTITAVLDGYRDRAGHVLRALDQMGTLARQMRDALVAGDIDGLAALVDEHWRHQRTLHPAITTERIDAIEHAARRVGALGLKALGASGGGCMIVFASDSDVDRVARSISPLAEILPWQVDDIGVRVHEGDSLAG